MMAQSEVAEAAAFDEAKRRDVSVLQGSPAPHPTAQAVRIQGSSSAASERSALVARERQALAACFLPSPSGEHSLDVATEAIFDMVRGTVTPTALLYFVPLAYTYLRDDLADAERQLREMTARAHPPDATLRAQLRQKADSIKAQIRSPTDPVLRFLLAQAWNYIQSRREWAVPSRVPFEDALLAAGKIDLPRSSGITRTNGARELFVFKKGEADVDASLCRLQRVLSPRDFESVRAQIGAALIWAHTRRTLLEWLCAEGARAAFFPAQSALGPKHARLVAQLRTYGEPVLGRAVRWLLAPPPTSTAPRVSGAEAKVFVAALEANVNIMPPCMWRRFDLVAHASKNATTISEHPKHAERFALMHFLETFMGPSFVPFYMNVIDVTAHEYGGSRDAKLKGFQNDARSYVAKRQRRAEPATHTAYTCTKMQANGLCPVAAMVAGVNQDVLKLKRGIVGLYKHATDRERRRRRVLPVTIEQTTAFTSGVQICSELCMQVAGGARNDFDTKLPLVVRQPVQFTRHVMRAASVTIQYEEDADEAQKGGRRSDQQ